MIKIYHNPRCAKSREGLAVLETSGKEFEIVRYLDDRLSEKELEELIAFLGIQPEQLIRKNEALWKENFKGKQLTDNQLIAAMAQNPKLIERPIVVRDKEAVVGRPAAKISELLSQ